MQTGRQPSRRTRRPFDAAAVEAALRAALAAEEPPPSLRTVSQRVAYSNAYLRRYFPELCDAIVARWRAYRSRCNQERLARCVQEVARVMAELREESLYPSAVRIIARSRTPLRLTERACHEFWKQHLEDHWKRDT